MKKILLALIFFTMLVGGLFAQSEQKAIKFTSGDNGVGWLLFQEANSKPVNKEINYEINTYSKNWRKYYRRNWQYYYNINQTDGERPIFSDYLILENWNNPKKIQKIKVKKYGWLKVNVGEYKLIICKTDSSLIISDELINSRNDFILPVVVYGVILLFLIIFSIRKFNENILILISSIAFICFFSYAFIIFFQNGAGKPLILIFGSSLISILVIRIYPEKKTKDVEEK